MVEVDEWYQCAPPHEVARKLHELAKLNRASNRVEQKPQRWEEIAAAWLGDTEPC